jgi:hypothetical protein
MLRAVRVRTRGDGLIPGDVAFDRRNRPSASGLNPEAVQEDDSAPTPGVARATIREIDRAYDDPTVITE